MVNLELFVQVGVSNPNETHTVLGYVETTIYYLGLLLIPALILFVSVLAAAEIQEKLYKHHKVTRNIMALSIGIGSLMLGTYIGSLMFGSPYMTSALSCALIGCVTLPISVAISQEAPINGIVATGALCLTISVGVLYYIMGTPLIVGLGFSIIYGPLVHLFYEGLKDMEDQTHNALIW